MSILKMPEIIFTPTFIFLLLYATSFVGGSTSSDRKPITIEVRVAESTDDAEERGNGSINLSSNDLELVEDTSGNQTVGMRFNQVNIPRGAKITNAYIQFRVDEVDTKETTLNIFGEFVDNASTFSTKKGNISSRSKTSANVAWSPLPWIREADFGIRQRTPDIGKIIQEITTRSGWTSRNSIVIMIQGTGVRTAEAYDGVSGGAALLHVEYTLDGNINPAVTINLRNGSTFNVGYSIPFTGSAKDFEDGDVSSTLVWRSNIDGFIGRGEALFHSELSPGKHIITATATDHVGLSGTDTTKISVFEESPILVGAGDIADNRPRKDATAKLIEDIPGTVVTLGDNTYLVGDTREFTDYYDPSWGRHLARTRPVPGNHDYDTPDGEAYYKYFGELAGDPDKGYYSYDIGDWHIIALNSNCPKIGGCDRNSPQGRWLQADLAANPRICTLAYFHHPKFSSSYTSDRGDDFWKLLYSAEADIILNGHAHNYERFAPQDPNGNLDPIHGIRQFVVGTGGSSLSSFGQTIAPNSEARNASSFGILKLTLNPTSYGWEFIPINGNPYSDSGSAHCVSSILINQAPEVDSGSNHTVTLASAVFLNGTVSDDGLPSPESLKTRWSMVSGPGTANFGDVSDVNTTAIFSSSGVYVLRLTGDDGDYVSFDDVSIKVDPIPNNQ